MSNPTLTDLKPLFAEFSAPANQTSLSMLRAVYELRRQLTAARELLEAVEWVQPAYNGSESCSCCGNQRHWGHAEGCELHVYLTEA